MKVHNIQQNSEEWDLIRLGKFTASTCDKLLSDENSKGYKELIEKIAEERFTGEPCQSKAWKGNSFTDRGHELEPLAIQNYERESFETVKQVGFVEKDSWCGCSPDGLIGDDKLIQVKCVIFRTHVEYSKLLKPPANYYKQMQFELFVTERDKNIFYCYHPKLSPIEIEIGRDDDMIFNINHSLDLAKERVLNLINCYKDLI